jgi:hypothetical protein
MKDISKSISVTLYEIIHCKCHDMIDIGTEYLLGVNDMISSIRRLIDERRMDDFKDEILKELS